MRARPLVLLVDDGRQHSTLLKLALLQRGYATAVARDLDVADAMVRTRPVDALVTTLPIEEAESFLGALGGARPRAAIAIAGTGDVERARGAGFDVVLVKPVDFGDLDAALRSALASRRSGTRARVRAARRRDDGTG